MMLFHDAKDFVYVECYAKNFAYSAKKYFLVQDVGYPIKQVHGQIRGPLFCLSVRQSLGSLSGKYFFLAFLAKLYHYK